MSKETPTNSNNSNIQKNPNILLLLVDQLRYPRYCYGDKGFDNEIKDILSFVKDLDESNSYLQNFPGFVKLREYSTVLTNHSIAESACIPSRSSIMTGQYGPRTGVTQTDGLFKSGDAQNFPWLKSDGFATLGDWFRQAGYSTHYFGKWHTSNPPEHTLQGFGFDDWELSWPEPHGSLVNNLGTFRDYQFADLACTFLKERGLGIPYDRATGELSENDPNSSEAIETKPFLAVCSFTNPHDIAAYPTLPRSLIPNDSGQSKVGPGGSVPVPEKGSKSVSPKGGYYNVPLNPTGLKQDNASACPSQTEDIANNNKPDCQFDYSVKLGLGLAAKTGLGVAKALNLEKDLKMNPKEMLQAALKATLEVAIPFQNQEDVQGATTGFLQYYAYMISMVDRHILRVIETLEESGLRDNTILVFASDHGEYSGSHAQMMEKWHSAYQEILHVPVLVSSPRINTDAKNPRVFNQPTSHIDLLPTLMGLANITKKQQRDIRKELSKTHYVAELPGVDLSAAISQFGRTDELAKQLENRSLLFATDDMISEPLPKDDDPHNLQSWEQYTVYLAAVNELKKQQKFSKLQSGPVMQPAHVRAVRSGEWKLVKYCDPWSKNPVADQWEMYNLSVDGNELHNLLVYNGEHFPTIVAKKMRPENLKMNDSELEKKALFLYQELVQLENEYLTPYPSAHPTAGN